jgi:nucleotide-binding universal stress UspA family protein
MDIRRILVPLDGSRLAEAALPAACSLAQTLGARLILLHALEREPPQAVHGEPHLTGAGAARAYLGELADRLRQTGLETDVRVLEAAVDDLALALHDEARACEADLIVMCAHGRTNLRDRLIGRTAARTVRHATVPILLRTVRRPEAPDFRLRRLLVPLELRQDIEPALDATRALAGPYGAAVTLLAVPEPPASAATRTLPGTAVVARDLDRRDLARRLEEVAAGLRPDVKSVETVVTGEQPTAAIAELSAALPADLVIVLTDPGEPRPSWFEPSTTQQLLGRHDLTLLLVKRPPGGAGQ